MSFTTDSIFRIFVLLVWLLIIAFLIYVKINVIKRRHKEKKKQYEYYSGYRRRSVGYEAEANYLAKLQRENKAKIDCDIFKLSDEELHNLYIKIIKELNCEKEAADFCNEWCRINLF